MPSFLTGDLDTELANLLIADLPTNRRLWASRLGRNSGEEDHGGEGIAHPAKMGAGSGAVEMRLRCCQ